MAKLTPQIQALLTYVNSKTGYEDTRLGDAIYRAFPNYPDWINDAHDKYGIPCSILMNAFAEWDNVKYSFVANADGKYGYLCNNGEAFINANITPDVGNMSVTIIAKVFTWSVRYDTSTTGGRFYIFIHDSDVNLAFGNNIEPMSKSGRIILEESIADRTLSWSVNGEEGTSATSQLAINASLKWLLFISNQINTYQYTSDQKVSLISCETSIAKRVLVPFYRNSQYGLLDLMSDTFYTNANTSGSFTYSLE